MLSFIITATIFLLLAAWVLMRVLPSEEEYYEGLEDDEDDYDDEDDDER